MSNTLQYLTLAASNIVNQAPSPAFSVQTPRSDHSDTGLHALYMVSTSQELSPPAPKSVFKSLHSVPLGAGPVTAPSSTPSFSWVLRASTPFTGQSPAPLTPDHVGVDALVGESGLSMDAVVNLDGPPEIRFTLADLNRLEPKINQIPVDVPTREIRCFQDQEESFQEKLRSFESTLGPEHPITREALRSLARILEMQGRYKAAEIHFHRLAETTRKTMGRSQISPRTCLFQCSLGVETMSLLHASLLDF